MTEKTTITGIIKYVAKTGGVKLEGLDKWFNPPKEKVSIVKNAYHPGDEVEIDYRESEIIFIKKVNPTVNEEAVTSEITPQGQKMLDEAKNGPTKDRSIVRQTCIKAASEVFARKPTLVEDHQLFELAEKMEEWVYR